MIKIFKKKSKILFLTKSDEIKGDDFVSVILSPQYYWVKKADLPVKKEREALRLAPSVFDGILPDGDFSYEVEKKDDSFILIAYDKNLISKAISEQFKRHRGGIEGIYFAQHEFSFLKECRLVNEQSSLVTIDGVVIQVPKRCSDSKLLEDTFDNVNLSNKKAKLSSFDNEVISHKDSILIGVVSFLLLSSFGIEYFNYKSELSLLEDKKDKISSEYNLPRTSIQLKSVKKSLVKKFNTQKSFRDLFYKVSKIKLASGEYIQSFEESKGEIRFEIKMSNPSREAVLKRDLSKNLKIISSRVKDNILKLRVSL